MESNPLPDIPLDLLLALEERFPIPRARPGMSEKDIYFESGKRETVDFLRAEYESQQDNILNKSVIREG